MEKNTAHYKLSSIKEKVSVGNIRFTKSAAEGLLRLGLTRNEGISIIISLTVKDFYKSMTTYKDHTVWQDVYRPMTRAGPTYIKLTMIDDVMVVSFKER